MQLEAIYEDGRISLLEPLKLRHRRVRVTVQIPDGEVEATASDDGLDEPARRLVATLDAIHQEARHDTPTGNDESKAEAAERLNAYARRADR